MNALVRAFCDQPIPELDDNIDPRVIDKNETTGPVEELKEVQIDELKLERTLKLEANLDLAIRNALLAFLRRNLDVFAWTHNDMVGINPEVMAYKLNIDPTFKPVRQKRMAINTERYVALKKEVNKLIANRFIRESYYPNWLANPVLVKKKNNK
ncbi:hypothetical protein ACOSP7_003326 [Xanthoceras sorbifolium]